MNQIEASVFNVRKAELFGNVERFARHMATTRKLTDAKCREFDGQMGDAEKKLVRMVEIKALVTRNLLRIWIVI